MAAIIYRHFNVETDETTYIGSTENTLEKRWPKCEMSAGEDKEELLVVSSARRFAYEEAAIRSAREDGIQLRNTDFGGTRKRNKTPLGHTVSAVVPLEVYNALVAAAQQQDRTVSQIVRRMLESVVNEAH